MSAVQNPSNPTFWQEETQLRTALNYPPHGRLISIVIEDTAPRARATLERLAHDLAAYSPHVLEERSQAARGVRIPLLITLPASAWPDPTLAAYLAALPPTARVRIDPDSLW